VLLLTTIPELFICGEFNDTISRSGYTVLDGQMMLGCDLEMLSKEEAMVYFKTFPTFH
jgi:hypothetical protein